MKGAKHGRLTAPAVMIIGGTGFTVATAAAQGWHAAIPIAVIAAVGYYVWGGRDSDMGAMLGRRVDERQILVRARAQSLAGVAAATAGLGGYTLAIALKDPVWPFVLILGVEAVAFIAGLAIYGPHGAG